jgi:O-antigen ligase
MTEFANALVDATPLWTTLLGLSIACVIGWWAVQGVEWAPLLVIASVPIQRALLIGSGDRHLTYTQVWLAAFLAGALLCFVRGGIRLRIDLVTAVFGLLVGLLAMSIVAGPPIGAWSGEIYRWVTPLLFFVFARSYLGPASVRRFGITLSTTAAVCFGWAMWQIIDATGPTSFERNGLMRVFGGFGEPNPFAAFLVFASLALAGIAWSQRCTRIGWIALGGSGLGIAAAVLTQSRGGFVGLAAGLGVFGLGALVLVPRQWRVPSVALAGVGGSAAIIAFVILAPWTVRHEAVTTANWAELEREAHWTAAWAMLKAHPWFGIGAGAFDDGFRQYTTDWRFRIPRGHAHNAYLQLAATAGIGAVVVYLALLAVVCRRLIQQTGNGAWSGIAIGTLAATTGLAFHGVFDYLHVLSLGLLFAGTWACALGVRNKDHQIRERNSSF